MAKLGNIFDYTPHSLESTPTLSSILEKQASDPLVGSKVFAAYPGPGSETYTEITYSQFAKIVDNQSIALYDRLLPILPSLKGADVPVIALLGNSGFHFAVTVLALLKLNVTVFVLAPANSEPAVTHLLTTCNVSVLIHGSTFSAIAESAASKCDIPTPTLLLEPLTTNDYTTRAPVLYPVPPVVPIIVHSSGSTAFPKPVRWSNASFLSNSQVMLTKGGWSAFNQPDNRFLCLGPLFHTMGLTIGLAGTICAGTTIVFPLTHSWPPSPSDIVQSLKSTVIKTCIIVPLLLEQLVDALEANGAIDPLKPLIDLRLLLTGGAHCPDKLATRLITRGVNLKCVYGSSETGHLMVGSHERPAHGDLASWNLMRPFPHTSTIFKPLDDDVPDADKLYQVHMAATDVRLAFGVMKLGEETWNTGDVVQEVPAGSGWYKLLYRDDDILVHVSGEKTNPVPMETSCRSHRLIDSIAIIGHRRPVSAAIVQLNEVEAQKHTEAERLSFVRDAIKAANAAAPTHSRVVEEMIYILPLGSAKRIPRTPKGNCIRPKVLQMFAEEIDALYLEFEGEDGNESDVSTTSSVVTLAEVHDQVSKIVEEVIEKPVSSPDSSLSLFDLGLDSVTAMRLRNRLAKSFGIKLPQQFVYHNFSLELLSLALHGRVATPSLTPLRSFSPIEKGPTKGEILSTLLERQLISLRASANLLLASRSIPHDTSEGEIVAIVGAAGSLGTWQVKTLLDRSDVRRVVCMVRGANVGAVWDKMINGFKKASLNDLAVQSDSWKERQLKHSGIPVVHLDQRLVVLPFDLGNTRFDDSEYMALAQSLTTIIHTGWKMDFNQVVQGFEKDCLSGTTQLLLLAGFIRPKRFYFISSIGVVLESTVNPVPEKIMAWSKDQYITASPHGYSESKFVCEYVVEAAASILGITCSIARVGQITGDTTAGVWKTQEMNPIIIAGSARIGKFPVVPHAILDWTPVDFVGRSTVELALGTQAPCSTVVHHIVNPTLSTYADMANNLCAAGVPVTSISPKEWWIAIQADEGNPCLAIEGYIEEAFVNAHADLAKTGGTALTLDISQTLRLAPNSLAKCPPLDGKLWKKYVQHWRQIGFLGQ